jgi:hypothetical protein
MTGSRHHAIHWRRMMLRHCEFHWRPMTLRHCGFHCRPKKHRHRWALHGWPPEPAPPEPAWLLQARASPRRQLDYQSFCAARRHGRTRAPKRKRRPTLRPPKTSGQILSSDSWLPPTELITRRANPCGSRPEAGDGLCDARSSTYDALPARGIQRIERALWVPSQRWRRAESPQLRY